jgi:hypothetical protein
MSKWFMVFEFVFVSNTGRYVEINGCSNGLKTFVLQRVTFELNLLCQRALSNTQMKARA